MFIGFDRPTLLPERAGTSRFPHRGLPQESGFFTGRVLELKEQTRDGDTLFRGTFRTNSISGNLLHFSTRRTEALIAEAFTTKAQIIVRGWIDHDGHLHIKESTFA